MAIEVVPTDPATTAPDALTDPAPTDPATTAPDALTDPAPTAPDVLTFPATTEPDALTDVALTVPDALTFPAVTVLAVTVPDTLIFPTPTDPAVTAPDTLMVFAATLPDAITPVVITFAEFNKFPLDTLAAKMLPVVMLAEYNVPEVVSPPAVTVPDTDNELAKIFTPIMLETLTRFPAMVALPSTATLPVAVMFVA